MEQNTPKPFAKRIREIAATPILLVTLLFLLIAFILVGLWVLVHGRDAMDYINDIFKNFPHWPHDWPPKPPTHEGSGI